MAAEDFVESEVAIVAAATAAAFSPRVRAVVRRGAVLGLSGLLSIGETVVGAARGAGRGMQRAVPVPARRRPVAATKSVNKSPAKPRAAAARRPTAAAAAKPTAAVSKARSPNA